MRPKIHGSVLAVVAVLLIVLVYVLRHVLIPFVLAAALTYVLAPLIQFCRRRLRCPRWAAALLVYLALVGGVGMLVWWGGSRVYARASRVSGNGQQELNRVMNRLLGDGHVTLLGYHLDAQQIAAQIINRVEAVLNGPQAATIAALGVSAAFGTVLFLVLLFYFFINGPELAQGLLRLGPPEYRGAIRACGAEVNPVLQRYLRGLCVIVLFSSVVTGTGAGLVFHLPHPLFLATATGLLELIPIIGPTTSATMLGAAAAFHGGGVSVYLGVGLFWFCLRMVMDQIVGPLVLGQAVNLHPVAVIFAFMTGGILFGLLGVLLAIPTAATVKILLDRYYALPVEE